MSSSGGSDMNGVVGSSRCIAKSSVSHDEPSNALLEQVTTLFAARYVFISKIHERLDVIDANHTAAAGLDELCEHVRKISASRTDVEYSGARPEKWKQRLAGGCMHMWGRYCGCMSNGLRGIGVWRCWRVVTSIDLRTNHADERVH